MIASYATAARLIARMMAAWVPHLQRLVCM
jgi:hypothetical protein